jgi:hypothetical protein
MAMNALDRKWCDAVHSLESCVLCGTHGIQWAHSNRDRGMSQKSDPWLTAALCPKCHHAIDNAPDLPQAERRALMDRAIVLTHAKLIRAGRLRLKGD